MKALSLYFSLFLAAAWTQTAPPAVPSAPPAAAAVETADTVIATLDDGTPMTLGQYNTILPLMPVAFQQVAQQQGRERLIHIYSMLRRAAALAKNEKLDQKSPYKETLEFSTMQTMADIYAKDSAGKITVSPAEVEKYYNEHKEPYKLIEVSSLKIAFGGPPEPAPAASSVNASRMPKKALTEDEAKAKAEKLVAQVRAGGDWLKLVQTESDDEVSKAKAGKLGKWRLTDNVPDMMREVVFGLKEGAVSDPVKQVGAYYIFRADAVTFQPLSEVRDVLFEQLKQQRSGEWMQQFDKDTKATFPNKK